MPSSLGDRWEESFWAKVLEEPTGCWRWTASLRNGYGQFGSSSKGLRKGKTTLAHRIAYELVVGVIPAGLTLDHLCRNRACVNPAHLEPVTPRENILRGASAPAINARKTHCAYGHSLSGANLYLKSNGRRDCKQCKRIAFRAFKARQKA